jgi:glutamine amidotransferase
MSTPKVLVVDYGVGNLLSVTRALAACGAEVEATDDVRRIAVAERVVLPGVGAFASCMGELKRRGLVDPLLTFMSSGRPFLGICVGLQMLMESGEEFGDHAGLGLIEGSVKALEATTAAGRPHKIPHIGWNGLLPSPGGAAWPGSILSKIAPGDTCYFVHSFAVDPVDRSVWLADCDYDGRRFCAAIRRDNIFGTQFHPEKSGKTGLAILSAFLDLA